MTKPDAPQDTPAEEPVPAATVDGEISPANEEASQRDSEDAAEDAVPTGEPADHDDDVEEKPLESGYVTDEGASYPAPPVHAPSIAYDESTAPDVEAPAVPEQDNATSEQSDKKPVRFALVGLAVGILVGFSFNYTLTGIQELVKNANSTVITAAVTDCNLEDRDGIAVTDNGNKLSIDTKGAKEESGASSQNAVCLIQSLNVPQDVIQKLDATKAGAERQSTEWEKRELAWEFTADDGIKMEYSIKN